MVLGRDRAIVLYCNSALAQRHVDAMVRRVDGLMVQWSNGSMTWWRHGVKVGSRDASERVRKIFYAQMRGVVQTDSGNDSNARRCKNVNLWRDQRFLPPRCESSVGKWIGDAELLRCRVAMKQECREEKYANVLQQKTAMVGRVKVGRTCRDCDAKFSKRKVARTPRLRNE